MTNRPLSLGNYLLEELLISEENFIKALRYQLHLKPDRFLTFPQVAIAFNYVNPQVIRHTLEHYPEMDQEPLGHLLLEDGLITAEELAESCQILWASPKPRAIGTILQELDYISMAQIEAVFDAYLHRFNPGQYILYEGGTQLHNARQRASLKIRRLIIERDWLNREQIQRLWPQRDYLPLVYQPLGEMLVVKGDIEQQELDTVMIEQVEPENNPLAQLLVRTQVLQEWHLSHLLCVQSDSGKNMAQVLVESGYIAADILEKVLIYYYRSMFSASAESHR
jgi:hypothetical protein